MSFAVNMQELRERASKRAASVATVATLLPDDGSKVAGVARVAQVARRAEAAPTPARADDAAQSARIYRLTRAQGDAAHAEPWNAEAIETFTARRDAILRRGYSPDDADDLAERLRLRDVQGDDRRMCVECSHYRRGRCGNHIGAGLHCPEVGRDLATLMQRCPGFAP